MRRIAFRENMPYYVYVIELDKKVMQSKKFLKCNPNIDTHKPCFYVGQTCRQPETRFTQHKNGYKANSFVKYYGLWLKRNIYEKLNPIHTRAEAEKTEEELADVLRQKGHGVWSH